MSEDPRRICVCGRQRSKEPVIITITTCKNNHGITTDGATVCVTSVSPQPESSTDQPVVGKPTNESTNSPPPSSNENTQSTPEVQAGSDAITEDTALPAESNQIETIEEVNPTEEEGEVANDTDADIAAESETDAPTEENPTTADIQEEGNPEEVDESTEQENAEIQIEDEGLEPAIATDEGNIDVEPSVEETNLDTNDGIDEDNPEEFVQSVSDQELQESQPEAEGDEITDPTVMMLTETAVNTVPFLNRLFWSSDMPSKKPTTSPQEIKECTLELIVLERHAGECRHNLANLSSERCIFDGESIITNCGRIDIPDETTFSETRIKKLAKAKARKICQNQDHPSSPGRYKSILEILKTYFNNKQIYDNLSTKAAPPFKQLQKYLTPPSDDECGAVIATTNDQSLQVGSTHISNKVSRWYDGFLMCIGLKAGESLYDVKGSKENLELRKESSSLMTKYLRI